VKRSNLAFFNEIATPACRNAEIAKRISKGGYFGVQARTFQVLACLPQAGNDTIEKGFHSLNRNLESKLRLTFNDLSAILGWVKKIALLW
jgi:hypothetical protein